MNAVRIASEAIEHSVTCLISREIARADELLGRAKTTAPNSVPA
jgi:hypothetical protein